MGNLCLSEMEYSAFSPLTEVASNAQFFEQNIKENAGGLHNRYAARSSTGMVFSDSFLDSLLCTVSHTQFRYIAKLGLN